MTGSLQPDAGNAAPGFFRATCLVAGKDLRMEWRTFERLAAMLIFSLVVLVIFNFAFDLSSVRRVGTSKLVPGILWITFAFSAITGFVRSFELERRRDSLLALALAPVDAGALFAGKALANLTTVWVLQLLVTPLSAIFFDFDLITVAGPLGLVLALHAVGLAELGTLFAAVTTRLGRGEALLATLLLPAATPLFLSAVRCTQAVLQGDPLGSVGPWLAVAAGLDILYLLVALLTFEYVLEE